MNLRKIRIKKRDRERLQKFKLLHLELNNLHTRNVRILMKQRNNMQDTAVDTWARGAGSRGWRGWIVIGAIVVNTTTATRRNRTSVASITGAHLGVASSKTRAHWTPFRSWGPGACRYSAVPTCAPLLFSGGRHLVRYWTCEKKKKKENVLFTVLP